MKLNNKGFTVVELLATFTLTMIVTMLLFEVVLELKKVYISSDVETLIKNENALVANELNKQIFDKQIPTIDATDNIITIGNKSFQMPNSARINSLSSNEKCSSGSVAENCIFQVSYSVSEPNLKEPIQFNLVLTYRG